MRFQQPVVSIELEWSIETFENYKARAAWPNLRVQYVPQDEDTAKCVGLAKSVERVKEGLP